MKILFLDIDGVLNDYGTATYFHYLKHEEKNENRVNKNNYKEILAEQFSNSSIGNLITIIKETNCKIVVSSTWRLGQDLDQMKKWFINFPIIQDAIIDKTDSIKISSKNSVHNIPRGLECSIWLSDNNINTYWQDTDFAIVDDDCDMWPLQKSFFNTSSYDGLTYSVARKIIDHLNKPTKKEREGKEPK